MGGGVRVHIKRSFKKWVLGSLAWSEFCRDNAVMYVPCAVCAHPFPRVSVFSFTQWALDFWFVFEYAGV